MKWLIQKERQKNGIVRNVIRRWNGNKFERLAVKKYQSIRDNDEELRRFVMRLNAPLILKEKVDFKHAFIDDHLLSDYLDFLLVKIPTESTARTEFGYLKNYFLNYFIVVLNLHSPSDWFTQADSKWATYLLSKDCPKSAKTKRDIINAANRFIKWLHKRRPNEFEIQTLEPISRAKFQEIEAKRLKNEEVLIRQVVPDSDLDKILKNAPDEISCYVHLIARYGLRRAEALGFKITDVKKGYLSVERQQDRIGDYKILKGKENRKTPHWYATPKQAHAWITAAQSRSIHKRTLSEKWSELMTKLGMSYHLHDLRHTFITKAVRQHEPRDVQLAVGHKDLRITMGYLHDDRGLEDEVFNPDEVA